MGAASLGGDAARIQAAASHTAQPVHQVMSPSGTDRTADAGTDRTADARAAADRRKAVSRDSTREALQDAADDRLQEVAEAESRERNAALRQLAQSAEQRAERLAAADRWVLPIDAGRYEITAGFGESSGLWSDTHTGLDFAAPYGTPVVAVARGRVVSTGYDGSYGNKTVIALPNGTRMWYCHQASFAVSPGDRVSSGQVIGKVGSTGNSTGSHLHLEVRPGAGGPVDPHTVLAGHGLHP